MDHSPWLWKKKSSEKTISAHVKTGFSLKGNQKEKTDLYEKLASLLSECNAKDELVSSNTKAAQEAIAGWEKAEAEAKHRKQELDETLQQKVAERERFYAALKDCAQQLISSAREEQDKRVHVAVIKASKELEDKHKKLEEKYVETSKIVATLTFENSQLTTALQVKEKQIDDTREQMSKVTGELNALLARLESTEKENTFLKSEFQKLEKELDVRNKEIEFNRQSVEASENKHSENEKKITKLEAECRKLRVLVRKRLLGPVALAKMKSEVEMQGRVPREVRDRRISFMMERVCEVEEENKILKEIACSKDEEVRSLRSAFALLASKLSQVEDQLGDHSKSQKSMELIDGFGSWASALLSQLENFKHGERDNASERRMTEVSDVSLMDDFVEMEKLAIVSVDPPSGDAYDSLGKELLPTEERDSIDMESGFLSTEKPYDWLQSVLKVILEQSRISKRSIDEILEDIRVALKYTDQLGATTDLKNSKPLPISGYINSNSLNSMGMENQLVESERSVERLQSELESLQEFKRLFEDQIENQKLINEDLDAQLNVSKDQLNELLQKLSSLEVELDDKSHCCEELEVTCLKLQRQLESVSSEELSKDNEEKDDKLFQAGWETTAASPKLAECQETILNHVTELKEPTSPKESTVSDKVLSKTSNKTLRQHSSLRDRLAEDGFEAVDPNSPKTKEIISTTEMKTPLPILDSSCGPSFCEVKTTVAGTLAIVPNKKRGGGYNLLRKLLFRRKKGGNKKKSRYRSTWEI